jgi:hypothetical protein
MEEMKWSSSGFLGVLAYKQPLFWLGSLAEMCHTFASDSARKT